MFSIEPAEMASEDEAAPVFNVAGTLLSAEAAVEAGDDSGAAEHNAPFSNPDSESIPTVDTADAEAVPATTCTTDTSIDVEKKWPGWPGDCVFRLIVPVTKVGSIIGRKGELIKRMCDESRARIRVLDGPVGMPDRIVLISGKEELEATLSPAMDAVIRVFKRVSGLSESEGDTGTAGVAICSIRLLVASTQAINLIGKQGSLIKSMQESTGASVRVISGDDVPFYVAREERLVELQGESLKVLKALEAVIGHLRKFLVDHSVLPLFEKTYTVSQDRQVDTLQTSSQNELAANHLSTKKESLYHDRKAHVESHITSSDISLYKQDTAFSGIRPVGIGRASVPIVTRASVPIVTQIIQTMQIPLSYAEDIVGVGGSTIAFIRRSSGAIITLQENIVIHDEITLEIKGTSSQVKMAQQLIQDVMDKHHREQISGSYGRLETGLSSSYYHPLGNTSSYSSSSLSSQPYGRYESSGLGGYSSFRL